MGRLSGHHPNIVNVLQIGKTDTGRPYLVMHASSPRCRRDQFHRRGSLDARVRDTGPLD
jgi:serine/threonine protein kinase